MEEKGASERIEAYVLISLAVALVLLIAALALGGRETVAGGFLLLLAMFFTGLGLGLTEAGIPDKGQGEME